MTQAPVTPAQVKAALEAVLVMAELIRELGEVQSGELYAQVMPTGIDIGGYERIIGILINAKLVHRAGSHLLTWVGPAKEEIK